MPKPPKPPSNPPLASRPRPPAPTTTPNEPPKPPKDTPNLIKKEQDLLPHLQKALSTLPPTLSLLTAFHHRNKNQHRLSPWWSHFDRLRRHLGKFLAAVEARVHELERLGRLSAKARAKLVSRNGEGGGGGDAEGDAEDEVLVRAWYLRGGVVPGGYLFVFLFLSFPSRF